MIKIPVSNIAIITVGSAVGEPDVLEVGFSILLPAGSTIIVDNGLTIDLVNNPYMVRLSQLNKTHNVLEII